MTTDGGLERHERLMRLFDQACDLGADALSAFLENLRYADTDLARELANLLHQDRVASGTLEACVAPRSLLLSGMRAFADPSLSTMERTAGADAALDPSIPGLPGFEVISTLAEGGMGRVLLAHQGSLDRQVAMKVLRPKAISAGRTQELFEEARLAGSLEHPNIVPVYDVGRDAAGAPIIVMKRVEGRPWNELLRDPAALLQMTGATEPLEANVRILLAVTNAIGFAHSRRVLHRDIKPENVMIGSFGEVVVLDWGLAANLKEDLDGSLSYVPHAHEVAGTPGYMAPEMLLDNPGSVLSPRTDVYLLGAVFYEIFAGHPPHEGSSLQEMIPSIALSAPRFREDFPTEARSICEKAMHRDPEERFQTVEEFRAAVEAYLQHRGSQMLADQAKQSLDELLRALAEKSLGEERKLAVSHLLGECRFGYRAALSAWSGNVAARRGLDRALVAVIDNELTEGDAGAAAALLREVSEPPADLAARVDVAVRRRAEEDERLRKLGEDYDPAVGSRTRTWIVALFGTIWTVAPLVRFVKEQRVGVITHAEQIGLYVVYLAMASVIAVWAREPLTRTLLNRRITAICLLQLLGQTMFVTGAWPMGLAPVPGRTLLMASAAMTAAFLAVWVEPWFAAVAAVTAVTFFIVSAHPLLFYPLASLDIAVGTLVGVFVWLPRKDLEDLRKRREKFAHWVRKQALRMRRSSRAVEDDGR
ncbi:MAG TPA: serine/threonine-protein kinase [Polyangium sp.]|nr:serine/threonine-protein kinase [Polyangium sp.]